MILNNSGILEGGKTIDFSYKLSIVFLSLIYSFSLTFFLPIDGSIMDRLNYLEYAEFSEIIFLRYFSRGFLDLLFNEPLWLLINILSNQFFDPQDTVRLIIFFSSYLTAYLVLKFDSKYFIFLLCILFFPMVIGKYTIHLRQGLAISVFLLGWFSSSKFWKFFFFLVSPLIHASFFFVLFLFFTTRILQRIRFSIDLRVFTIILIGLILGFGLEIIAKMVGARQSEEYLFTMENISGLGFLFWFIVLIIYWCEVETFTKEHAFVMTSITFYLSTYFLIEVTARIFESTIIIVLLASINLTEWRKNLFLIMFSAFLVISWLIKFNQPWLGWG